MALGNYSYPLDIGTNEKYRHRKVIFTVRKPDPSASTTKAMDFALEKLNDFKNATAAASDTVKDMTKNLELNREKLAGEVAGQIALPLPNTFTDSQAHDWSVETGVIGTVGGNIASASVNSITGKFFKIPGFGDLSADKVLGATSNALGTRKPLIDPGYFQNYSGSKPRAFTMAFDFVPESGEEATAIMGIIMKLKQFSSPTEGIKYVSLLAPYYFDIQFSNPYLSAMAKIDGVVLTNISVDYGADGYMQQTWDGNPKHISLSLSFSELSMSKFSDWSTKPKPQTKL